MENLSVALNFALGTAARATKPTAANAAQKQPVFYRTDAKGNLLFVKDRKWKPFEYEEYYQRYLDELSKQNREHSTKKKQVMKLLQEFDTLVDRDAHYRLMHEKECWTILCS